MTRISMLNKNKSKIFVAIILIVLLCFLIVNFQMKIFQSVYSSKVWAHRVNSIEKYQEARDIFSGIELDLMFDVASNTFDVNHPPAKSINLSLPKGKK